MFAKRILILLVVTIMASQMIAQIEKGTKRFGPDMSISSQFSALNQDNSSSTINFFLGLTGGYFFLNNLEIGADIELFASNARFAGVTSFSSTGITAGPKLVYMTPLRENLYLPLSVGYGFSSSRSSDNFGDASFSGNEFTLGSGLEYIVQSKLGVRFTVEYEVLNFKDNNAANQAPAISSNRILANVGFNFYF